MAKIVDDMLAGEPHTIESRWIEDNKFMARFDSNGKNFSSSKWLMDLLRTTTAEE